MDKAERRTKMKMRLNITQKQYVRDNINVCVCVSVCGAGTTQSKQNKAMREPYWMRMRAGREERAAAHSGKHHKQRARPRNSKTTEVR